MKKLFASSLRSRIVGAVGILVFVGLMVQAFASLWIGKEHAMNELRQQTRALARAHAEGISVWISARQAVVRSIAAAASAADPVPALQQGKIAGAVDIAYIAYPDKRIFFSEKQELPPGFDPTTRPWYQQAASAGRTVLTAPYVDASTKKLVITFANPIMSGGTLQAVAALDVFMDGISTNVASIRPTPGTFGFLANRNGQIMVHEDVALVLKPAGDVADGFGQGVERLANETLTEMRIRGQDRLVYIEPVKGTDWYLVVALDKREALAGIAAMTVNAVISLSLIHI